MAKCAHWWDIDKKKVDLTEEPPEGFGIWRFWM